MRVCGWVGGRVAVFVSHLPLSFLAAAVPHAPALVILQVTALVGKSGAGKSTIVHLLMRFYQPVKGEISLAGHDLNTLSLSWMYQHLGLVAQDVQLLEGTVQENIAYGLEGYTSEQVCTQWGCARALQSHAADVHEVVDSPTTSWVMPQRSRGRQGPGLGISRASGRGTGCSIPAGGRSRAPGPHAYGNAATQVVDDRRAEVRGQQKPSNAPRNTQHNRGTPTTGHR